MPEDGEAIPATNAPRASAEAAAAIFAAVEASNGRSVRQGSSGQVSSPGGSPKCASRGRRAISAVSSKRTARVTGAARRTGSMMLLIDDARVVHESTPIQPVDPAAAQQGYRDTLVVTLRSGGFLDAA